MGAAPRASTHSIRVRLPALISLLIIAAIAIFLHQAYREVEGTLVVAGRDRATRAAEQVSGLLERSLRQTADNSRRTASDPDLRRCLEASGEDAACEPARVRLSSLASSGPRRVEVWNRAGVRILDLSLKSTARRAGPDVLLPSGRFPAGPGFGPIDSVDGQLIFHLATAIAPDPSRTAAPDPTAVLGYLVVGSPLVINPPDALSRLAGPDATVAIGNATGGTWSDKGTVVPAPPANVLRNEVAEFLAPNGEPRIGAVSAIRGTPWALWVHFPRSIVLAPARDFQQRMGYVALTLILVCALLVLGLSIRITTPIHELAAAAAQIASGDYSRRVSTTRRDEIGQLARTFNDMAENVSAAHRQLEVEMLDRSRDEAHYRAIVEMAFDCIISMDANGRITEFNPAAERTFGHLKKDVLGQELAEVIIPPELRAAHRGGLARYLATGNSTIMGRLIEVPAIRADGERFPVELAISAVPMEGSSAFTGVLRNISGRKRAEEARLRSQAIEEEHRRMVEGARLKNEFLANMSHELRTPLNAIIGFSELMYNGKVGPLAPQHQEYLGDVLSSSKHLLQLINDVLDLAKVEAGRMDFHPTPVDLPSLVAAVRDIVRGLLGEKRLAISVEVDPGLTTVIVDAARVKQILYNYLSNAIKFTPEGGTVDVRVTLHEPGMFRIDVIDSGIGIAAEDIGKLFMPFQQLNSTAAKEYAGTGLGLSLTKQLAEAQGGYVAVRSVPGQGSVFTAVLPREPAAAATGLDGR
jgi:PAS domain S-box-containing protein